MSAASRLPVVAGTLSLGAFVAGLAALPSVREFAFTYFGSRVSKNMWKIAALVLALANFKNLPGVWHVSWRVKYHILERALKLRNGYRYEYCEELYTNYTSSLIDKRPDIFSLL